MTHDRPGEFEQQLKEKLGSRYPLMRLDYCLNGQSLQIFTVADPYKLLDRIDPEEFQQDERLPYWAEVWPAAIGLAELVLTTEQFQHARCLELGAGVGIVSVAAAIAGARVLATDYFQEALEFVQLNAWTNQAPIETYWLDWRSITLQEQFDYIFAADVLYEQRNHEPILQAIAQLLKPDGSAYISDPQRMVAQEFLLLAAQHHFQLETISRSVLWGAQLVPIDVHTLSLKKR